MEMQLTPLENFIHRTLLLVLYQSFISAARDRGIVAILKAIRETARPEA